MVTADSTRWVTHMKRDQVIITAVVIAAAIAAVEVITKVAGSNRGDLSVRKR